ncbi:YebC/PmpR family DNA-binding transcriptional regulator [Anoxybacillus geothermalis]|jgi:YebC/PmpR family DNA-binding regulatory protein|uniref:YebC/PmpR family DNA-binding transcriptional regulator n=1 Tax=unclassified Geobacillus TaxID=2642459 RepID=UPI000649897F|nr:MULTISPECIES: YebC/PmpR family DNA-binding transcriptional regulator [unclassified Geobacillus]AKM19895.1 putative transcriptional regulatory protein [Geobacillus sp. 12AMOR1]ASS86680.1 transcriptional regulator [Geobacillus lituanicus]KZM58844.1 transcriptional regulator [Geobacillus stearothermophilus]MED0655460.1 YebC/PmpR family DNA-binding transcriptional regulator [Anoxybacillus geothermalis]STO13188.1 Probable transcriptional regulatory protein HI_0315 [[Flavobacterium] thermophilum]
MAGHSKWKNIQRRKNAQDAKRGKLFMKLAKEIYVAAKMGGGDPAANPGLRLVIEKARAANMPNDNIERAIKKATGNQEQTNYEEIRYEGYGPGGVAVMVVCLTDNKNRTAANVRAAFSKNGGNLGETGCVSYLFERKGLLIVDREQHDIDEDELLLLAIEAGAEEMETTDESFEIYTAPESFESVKEQLEQHGLTFASAEITMIPQTYTTLEGDDLKKMLKLIDTLEDDDDVQEVYHNLDESVLDE